ncbi:MAG TPA: sugar ABC transporter ATP-binding protein, partial [Firmicutes bacterium]|nr:sugar ABC transporter ATP-binding protein [Bacillota bacterium]
MKPAFEAGMPPEWPLLRMRGIRKAFSGQPVLHGVDFDLRPGEVHILAGENGAGKSTLIKILAGVHTDYEGAIELDGAPVRFRNPQEAAGRGIAVIHQELSLVPSMSVADNIFLGRERCRFGPWLDFRSQQWACRKLLERLELDLDLNRPVGDYPLSIQQTIEIAGALAFDAQVIVMDEPTSALAEPEVERLFALIAELKKSGCAIVYITHRMEEIYRIGDRITVLRDGNGVGTAPASELPREELVRWMVGRDLGEQFPRHAAHLGRERLRVERFTLPDPEGLRPPVVQEVSFTARAGEILGIAGLQGSGASELLAGLFGVYGGLARGNVWLDGEPFEPGAPSKAIGRGMALLTNDRKTTGLVLGMSISHNITLASIPKYSPGTWLRPDRERRAAERH